MLSSAFRFYIRSQFFIFWGLVTSIGDKTKIIPVLI